MRYIVLGLVVLWACGDDSDGGTDASVDTNGVDVRGVDVPGRDSGPSDLVTWAESDVADIEALAPAPHVAPEVDTSGWTEYDATAVGGTDPDGPADFSSCANLDNTGGSDNSEAFGCMWQGMGDNACLLLPAGTYAFGEPQNNIAIVRPSFETDHRCLRGEGMGANNTAEGGTLINITADYTNPTVFIDFEEDADDNWLSESRSWNSGDGGMRGDTVLRGIDTSGMSAGQWLYLSADPNTVQPVFLGEGTAQTYHARIASIDGDEVTIDRALPDDFDGGGAQVRVWNPAEQVAFENFAIQYEDPNNQFIYQNWHMALRHLADSHIRNVRFLNSYQVALTHGSHVARVRIAQNAFELQHWDKPYNGYMVQMGGSDITIIDNYLRDTPQAFACGAGHGMLFAFNHIDGSTENPDFDRNCDEPPGNACRQVGDVQHCSRQPEDLDGTNGDAACRGTRADVVSGSVLLHNNSCSSASFVRNSFASQPWFDFHAGPGRHNLWFGNRFEVGRAVNAVSAAGMPGDMVFKDGPRPGGYENNMILVNNSIENLGTFSSFDIYGNGIVVRHNVIRGQCFYNNESGENADGDDCVEIDNDPGRSGINTTWSDNDVGQMDRSTDARMPSAPGFEADPNFGGSTPFPYVGADMGPAGGQGCLPAYERYFGSCP